MFSKKFTILKKLPALSFSGSASVSVSFRK